MTASRRRLLAVATVSLVVLLAVVATRWPARREPATGRAATGPSTAAGTAAPAGPRVVVPGRPGESADVRRADAVAVPGVPPYNTLDVEFVRMMIPHHSQALQMAELAPGRAGDVRIRALAERIRAGQAPEILRMRGWLQARHLDPDARRDGHGTMRGMQTPEAIRALSEARGAAFDMKFVEMMIQHHQGAVDMSTDLLKVGRDEAVAEIANAVAAEQTVEIGRMRDLLTG
jgi:uncharacterized protein (DUF305 family)